MPQGERPVNRTKQTITAAWPQLWAASHEEAPRPGSERKQWSGHRCKNVEGVWEMYWGCYIFSLGTSALSRIRKQKNKKKTTTLDVCFANSFLYSPEKIQYEVSDHHQERLCSVVDMNSSTHWDANKRV